MSNSRQRMLDAFNYNNPDKIPVVYHPSTAGLYVHGHELIDLFNRYPADNPIIFDKIPAPDPHTINKDGEYHELIKDEWGTVWNYRIYGVAGHPKFYPFNSWKETADYQFPPIPAIHSSEFLSQRRIITDQKKEFLIFNGWISIFERLHALRPFEEVLTDILVRDQHLIDFLHKLLQYWTQVIEYYTALGTDVFVFGDDWGTQRSQLIPPDLFREIFKPLYLKLFSKVKRAGGKVFLHCCGFMGEILDEFIGLGIDGLWPQISLYEKDESFVTKCQKNSIAVYIHPDRQNLIPLGTPQQIDRYIHKYAEKYQKLGGGGIFYVEIENDAPFQNVKALIEAIHRYR